ncbi:hypothetical protein EDD66_10562 [Mobilisporobacter senegalensis]|uniref:DUF7768 domain-containing protein n=1 Tax=Mobilisporobacter senegalensis TaxID=1329262 RepID=A0A3N1XN66_9FIRM|nr:DUF4406 domain-containing protein [Mobilisporobacter senegalensis]ROR28124.1 hypothetical protein EDD66_10562 [Mobilisporobacter senegalensis]
MDKYNAEGYPDPTAAEAIENVMRDERAKTYKPCVFICSPFAGDTLRNLKKAREYLLFAVEQGTIPFAPHLLYPQVLDDSDPEQRKLGQFFGMVWLRKCDELWVFGGYISKGMQVEIDKALKHRIPIRYFNENCKEVQQI